MALRLNYFGFGGRARAIRLALRMCNIAFEDHQFGFPQWPELKAKCPYGTCPVLEIGVHEGVAFPDAGAQVIGSSNAILMYVGMRGGMLPSDPVQLAQEMDVLDWCETWYYVMTPSIREQDADKKRAMREELQSSGSMGAMMAYVDNIYAGGGFLHGASKPGVADLKIETILRMFKVGAADYFPADYLDQFKNLSAFYDKVAAAVAPYNEK